MSETLTHAIRVYLSKEAAMKSGETGKLITVSKKNPVRHACVFVPAMPDTSAVPEQFAKLVDALMIEGAKRIIDEHCFSGKFEPSWIPGDKLTPDAILDAARDTGSNWMTKEQLETAWRSSYKYAQAAAKLATLTDATQRRKYSALLEVWTARYTKLSAKNATYTPDELDAMIANLTVEDMGTEFGEFVCMRVEAIRNKPAPEVDTMALL